MRRPDNRARGFTLLEVLVAFTILALMLAVLLQVFSGGLRTAQIARDHAAGVLLAQSKLATLGIEDPLVEGESTGSFDNGFRWHSSVTRYLEGEGGEPEIDVPVSYRLDLTVAWGNGRSRGSVTLTTLRLGPPVEGSDRGPTQ